MISPFLAWLLFQRGVVCGNPRHWSRSKQNAAGEENPLNVLINLN